MSRTLAHASGADETLSLLLLFSAIWIGWIGWSRLRGTGFARMPPWGEWAAIAVAAALVVAATVAPRALLGGIGGPAVTVCAWSRPASSGTLAFVTPPEGLATAQDRLTVRLDLDGATITSAASTSVSPDTGHIHLRLDDTLISMAGGTLQVVDLRALAPGRHTLRAELVAADHLPFDPPVEATVSFVTERAT